VPRPGRTLAVSLYRPLAEQLAGLAAPHQGERVLELSSGDGELTVWLTEALGAGGSLDTVERPWNFTQPSHHFDLAISLLAIETPDELHAVLPQLAVVAARTLVATFGGGARHDNALRTAWRDVVGEELGAVPSPDPVSPPAGWRQRRLSDVARFDGVAQLLTALTVERGIDVPAGLRDPLQERLARELAPFTAADGTMRIPVHLTVVESGTNPGSRRGR
jgi:hypothetical protein